MELSINTLFYPFAAVLTFATYQIFKFMHHLQQTPYIDETFHIPQAQNYCQNQWEEWNPKITTLPGLYLISYAMLKPLGILGVENYCSVFALRFTNVVATVLNFFLAYKICCSLEEKYKVRYRTAFTLLSALNIAIFPPLYFFTFLYYTDVWSVTFVLMMYRNHLLRGTAPRVIAFFASIMAIMLRQTNVVWVIFLFIDRVWEIFSSSYKYHKVQDLRYTRSVLSCLKYDCFCKHAKIRKQWGAAVYTSFMKTWHYLAVLCLFLAFVIINRGVVVGDKEAHTVRFHLMQNYYLLAFISFFALPFLYTETSIVWRGSPTYFTVSTLIAGTAILNKLNKLEHPYLLSDNRHLAFYVWKRIFGHKVFRYVMVPVYVFVGFILFRFLQRRCNVIVLAAIAFCCFLSVSLQFLFELRYFIIPYVMFRLQFMNTQDVFTETLMFISINASVIYLYAFKPFEWITEPGVKQRIIW